MDVDEIRLSHYRGGCGMVAIREVGATVGEETMIVVGGSRWLLELL